MKTKEEKKADKAAYYVANREKIRAEQAAYRAANSEKIKAAQTAYRTENAEEITARRAARRAANPEKTRANRKKRYVANIEKERAYQSARRAANPEKIKASQLMTKYGLSPEAFRSMLLQQENACGICKKVFSKTPCVDHCHKTGEVRGLLCRRCNVALGAFGDSLEGLECAKEYLNKKRKDS